MFTNLAGGIVGELLLADKVSSNRKMVEQLGVHLRHPSYHDVLASLARQAHATPV